jgi:hypothetical protein
MGARLRALALAVVAPFILVGCVLVPGKFASTLHVAADRSFAFTYQGEVIAIDLAGEMAKIGAMGRAAGDADTNTETDPGGISLDDIAFQDAEDADEQAKADARFRAIADALRKEPGYRSIEYKGDGLFAIDYATRGSLTHGFVYPYNIDAEVIFPFVVIELRGRDQVRVKAPAFGETDTPGGMGGPSPSNDRMDGTFTLTTDAEVVSQNNEDGVASEDGRKKIVWKATPLSQDAPMAVLRVQSLR